MSDIGPTGSGAPNSGYGGAFLNLVNVFQNIARILSAISTSLANVASTLATSVINLGNNNVFTGINKFAAGIEFADRIVTAAGAITVTTADIFVTVNKTVGAATAVSIPGGATRGTIFVIKDGKGDSGTNNITITPTSGTIDGAGSLVISTNFGAARLVSDGVNYGAW